MNLLNDLFSGDSKASHLSVQDLLQWVEQQGGAQGVIDKFRQNGLGHLMPGAPEHIPSTTEPLTDTHLQQIFGVDEISVLAGLLGVSSQQASGLLSTYLPKILPLLSADGSTSGIASRFTSLIKNLFSRS